MFQKRPRPQCSQMGGRSGIPEGAKETTFAKSRTPWRFQSGSSLLKGPVPGISKGAEAPAFTNGRRPWRSQKCGNSGVPQGMIQNGRGGGGGIPKEVEALVSPKGLRPRRSHWGTIPGGTGRERRALASFGKPRLLALPEQQGLRPFGNAKAPATVVTPGLLPLWGLPGLMPLLKPRDFYPFGNNGASLPSGTPWPRPLWERQGCRP